MTNPTAEQITATMVAHETHRDNATSWPALVTVGDWRVSYTTGSDVKGCVLHMYRGNYPTPTERDPRDGDTFPTYEHASAYAYLRGALRWR